MQQISFALSMQVHDELRSYDNLIADLQAIEEYDLEAKICDIRGDLHAGFFEHLTNLVYAAHQDHRHREGKGHVSLTIVSCKPTF